MPLSDQCSDKLARGLRLRLGRRELRLPPYESPTIRAEAQVPYPKSRTFGFGRASTTDPFTAKTRCVPNVIIFPLTSQSFLINLGNVWMLRTFFQAHWTF